MPHTAYIVEAVRTAGGRRNGKLSKWHPADLGAQVVDELVRRTKIDGAQVDDVIFGCVSQIGAQSANLGRGVVLSSELLPESVPGTTVDRQCGSSQQAIHFAAQAVMSGTQDCVIAGGVEIMSLVPIGSNVMDGAAAGRGMPTSEGMGKRYPGVVFSQFEGAEILANRFGVKREDLDQLGYLSHQRAAAATQNGYFQREIVPVKGYDKKTDSEIIHKVDEGIRPGVKLEKMKTLPTLKQGGVITAGTASQICDGAAAIMICNENGLRRLGLKPRAKIVALALAGDDPVMMLGGPIPATRNVLRKSGLTMADMDLYEVNEAFASVPLAWLKELKGDLNKLNVNGGAMALGHPLGGTGAKLMTTLLHELERRGGRYGIQAICEGGGTANATIIEIVSPNSRL
eukprot:CAMPEP_0205829164 /NCGR_PEP_ID=MMETSP0206-20130828/37236_1 /ASSEMBLY_ACC=CAM_ASM_000279 /TAXON_ID=36767 /ORGANISM="Euplotes focardii, Strain TN1" /LENGTH=399 /DNA_ID=CAMNT_0053131623 /DNA_START=1 /DNA_END=1200 /DNA_ORIENTATION=+